MSSSKKIYPERDFAAGVYQNLKTGDTVQSVMLVQYLRPSFVNYAL
jgi:hypothetical protein